jgi:hypothetical protein
MIVVPTVTPHREGEKSSKSMMMVSKMMRVGIRVITTIEVCNLETSTVKQKGAVNGDESYSPHLPRYTFLPATVTRDIDPFAKLEKHKEE